LSTFFTQLRPLAAFRFSSIQVNYNPSNVRWHRDTNNLGPSCILAVGNFTGGEFQHEDAEGKMHQVDINHKLFFFDGTLPHSALPHQGERYSFIAFEHNGSQFETFDSSGMRDEICNLGFPMGAHRLGAVGMEHADHPRILEWDNVKDGAIIHGIYLFAGPSRHSSIRSELELLTTRIGVTLQWDEVDILQITSPDASDDDDWAKIIRAIKAGKYHILIAAPPCEQYSRALFANRDGPRPLRDRRYPRGFPWMKKPQQRKQVALHNLLHDRTREALREASNSPTQTDWLVEFPEDLGKHKFGTPATFWDDETKKLVADCKASSVAHFTCRWGVNRRKPERTASTFLQHTELGPNSWPMINKSTSFYEGPLPKDCGCATAHPALIGKTAYGDFQTHAASAWPPAFNRWVAIMAYNSAMAKLCAARVLGGDHDRVTMVY
jgi:hypothetical protein